MKLTSGRLARALEDDIIQRRWPIGEVLGSEAQLMADHGVGRNVFRETVRILETHGVARRRQGPGGGLVVAAPQPEVILDATRLFLDYRETHLSQLYDVWIVLEGLAVQALSADLDPASLLALRQILRDEAEWDEQTNAAAQGRPNIHIEIARLAANPVIELFLQTVFVLALDRSAPHMVAAGAAWLRAEHVGLVEAMAVGDVGLAQTHVRRIVKAVAKDAIARNYPGLERPDDRSASA